MRKHLMTRAGLVMSWLLLSAPSVAGPYRDKHGNVAQLALTTPLVGAPLNGGIHFTLPYVASDSDGGKTGHYQITSRTSPGRGATDDFVLSILVTDDRTQKGAELVIRSHPTTAPLGPVLRLLDCRTLTCTEDKRIADEIWGSFVIRSQSDIALYPIELLDAHAILQLLEPALLALLPNTAAGTGNWAEILQHHQIAFQEAKFRAEIDSLGSTQSNILTGNIIPEVALLGTGGTNLIQEHASLLHHHLTFLTDHDALIEKLANILTTKYTWHDFTFPYGRMPAWFINDDFSHAGGSDFDPLPQFWDRVQQPGPGHDLDHRGCFHKFRADTFVPSLTNGGVNIGQYVCAASPAAPDGFVDRRCELDADYFRASNIRPTSGGLDGDMEARWHDGIHGFMGGEQTDPSTTAGTASFWPFHTLASSIVLANWRYAQTRNMPAPTSSVDPAALIDVNFLIDLSGSFDDDLPNFKSQIPVLIDELAAQFPAIKFSLGSFQDYPIAPFGSASSGDVAYERLVDFNDQNDPNNNAGVVKNTIAGLTVRSGVDGPQSQLAALFHTVNGTGEDIAPPFEGASIPAGQQVHFRQQATKIILLFTDAGFHNPGDPGDIPYPGPTFEQTVAAIQNADPPMVIGISSGGGGIADLQLMATATGAIAPAGGADCDSDGVIDVPAGAPLVCATTATSTGIGDVLTRVIDAAVEEAKTKDTDADGLPDLQDNCPTVANVNQADLERDSIGDVCDSDDDGDGIDDVADNCPVTSNHDQIDSDGDGNGNACDTDDDNDGVLDPQDPCPLLATSNVITGTAGNDRLTGTSGNDLILGLAGKDNIDGRGGNDCLVGGAGSDRILGGDGDDIISGGDGDDELDGQAGNDTLTGDDGKDLLLGGAGDDQIDGGRGNDKLHGDDDRGDCDDHHGDAVDDDGDCDYDHGGRAVTLGGVDSLDGGDGDDRLFGGDGNDFLQGGPGDDVLFGMNGDDEVLGDSGNDRALGGSGDDTVSGADGDDEVSGGSGNDRLDGGIGSDVIKGGAGDDFLYGGFMMPMPGVPDDVDRCFGGSGSNTLVLCSNVNGHGHGNAQVSHAQVSDTLVSDTHVSDAHVPDARVSDEPTSDTLGQRAPGPVADCALRPGTREGRNDAPLVPVIAGLAIAAIARRWRRAL